VAPAVARLLDQRSWSRVRLATDAVVLYLATAAAVFAAPTHATSGNHWLAACFPLIALAAIQLRPGPDARMYGSVVDTVAHVLGLVSLAAIVTLGLQSVVGGDPHPVSLALRLWLFGFVYVAGARIALISVRRHAMHTEALATPTLIIGAGQVGEHLVKRLSAESRYGLRPVGFLDADPMPESSGPGPARLPVLGGPADLEDVVTRTGARHVIIAFSNQPDGPLVDTINECRRLGLAVSVVPRLYESLSDRATIDRVGGMPLIRLNEVDPQAWQFAIKHALDKMFAFIALVLLSPLMAAIAIAVKLSSPGPVLFSSRRVGRDGKSFHFYKFRSMRGDPRRDGEFDAAWMAKQMQTAGENDGEVPETVDRRTRVGIFLRATSLDELPQLLNVLRGDMSLIGPRPEREDYVAQFNASVRRYGDRHRVRSGMTGWAQVNGLRGPTSITDRVEWDNYYVQNWSLWLDLRILVLTVAEILKCRG
jgi:exopolysaccharide biosynthesis polyprenyl glycosylphosphotransferase